jgi:hypothetical protein
MRSSDRGMETKDIRTSERGMETKEFRSPREPEDSLEPTPEMIQKRRAAKQGQESRPSK